MFRVYESRESIPEGETDIITAKQTVEEVCLTAVAYHGMIGAIIIVIMLLLLFAIIAGICFKKKLDGQMLKLLYSFSFELKALHSLHIFPL